MFTVTSPRFFAFSLPMFRKLTGYFLPSLNWFRTFYSCTQDDSFDVSGFPSVRDEFASDVIPIVLGRARVKGKILFVLSDSPGIATVVIGICKGPIALRSIYANGEALELNSYRFYSGTEDQAQDAELARLLKKPYLPPFKGLAYAVFENLSLSKFGGRVPSFHFDVEAMSRAHKARVSKINAVNIIPGSGEFVYEPRVITKQVFEGEFAEENVALNSADNRTSSSALNLQFLKEELPGVEWVAPIVCWFGTDLNIAKCRIVPKAEAPHEQSVSYVAGPNLTVVNWKVGNKTRFNVEVVCKDGDAPRYGGTPSDESVLAYLKSLKQIGYKVMFYPMVLLDVPGKPWRGQITGGAEHVSNFFKGSDGYESFILHYASLTKGLIDAFIIGSEFCGLTEIFADNGGGRSFPAVTCFVELAAKVRSILGNEVKITYAASWSEYHHAEGGWYKLDDLWACKDIDVVGIDAYFPVTESYTSRITAKDIKSNYRSLTESDEKWRLEAIEQWWRAEHFNPNERKTSWVPKSKKIWITEFGFPSVDKSTNEPYKFPDKQSSDETYPTFSSREVDFALQEEAIEAALDQFNSLECIERAFLWCWDARYPIWPGKGFECKFQKEVDICWSDYVNWAKGHWINGKLCGVCISEIIELLLLECGFSQEEFKIDEQVRSIVSGFVVDYQCSTAELLRVLALQHDLLFAFDGNGILQVKPSDSAVVHNVPFEKIIYGPKSSLLRTRCIAESSSVNAVNVRFIEEESQRKAVAGVSFQEGRKSMLLSLPIVMSSAKASSAAWHIMSKLKEADKSFAFKTCSDLELNPGDLVRLNQEEGLLRILEVKFDGTEKCILASICLEDPP